MPFEPIEPRRLFRLIAEQVATMIQRGDLPPGSRLPAERELATRLGVSRPSLREALIALELEGLVEVRGGSGVYVRPPPLAAPLEGADAPGPFDILEARARLEPDCAALAARHGALSADHLEYLDAAGVQAMAAAGTVAVILPGAFYTLRETQAPPLNLLRAAGVPMAVATDCNPGSSPMTSLTLAMNMACTLFRLTPTEALAGTTRNAARALGLTDCGEIRAGMRADLAIWDVLSPAELPYGIAITPLHARIFGGVL
jgi:imidazolonepropionase